MNNLIQWPRAKYWTSQWNPVIGCKPCSPACENCYAAAWAKRFGQSTETCKRPSRSCIRNTPTAQLLVSTSAPAVMSRDAKLFPAFCELSMYIPKIGIQFSVHESTDKARRRLIPTPTCSLEEIARLGRTWARKTWRKPFYNYCVHPGNTSDADVDWLIATFDPEIWETTLSVICEKDETMKASHERQLALIEDFSRRLVAKGASVRIFNPAGQDDIGGGCGQLWFFQKWLREHGSTVRNRRVK